jgi:predicted AAA+ superfamily ATPase
MEKIKRLLQPKIEAKLDKGKVLVLYGPRQVGKTTLVKEIAEKYNSGRGYFNCEENIVRETLLSMDSGRMFSYFSGNRVIVLDEAGAIFPETFCISAYPYIILSI